MSNKIIRDKNTNGIPDILESFDTQVISFFHKHSSLIARIALFVLFFWFGILKVFELSPAGPLVIALAEFIFSGFLPPEQFLFWFGIFESITAILILFPRFERLTFLLLFLHLISTAFPLFVLPEFTWDAFLVPNLTGQYIIKNLALLALGISLFAKLRPITETHSLKGEEVK